MWDFVVKLPADGQKALYRLLVGGEGSFARRSPSRRRARSRSTPARGTRLLINNGSLSAQATKARMVAAGFR